MGLIKTAMMSGAAIYGINKIAQTAQARNNNSSSPPRRDYAERDYDVQRQRPLEFRGRDSPDNRFVDSRDMQERSEQPRQRLYLQDQRPSERQAYYSQAQYEDYPQYEYASNMRSPSAPAQYYPSQRSQPGFVETESIMSDPRDAQGSDGAEMLNMLAQQAKNMGLVGGKKGKKDKDGKGDLMESLMSRA